MDKFFRWFGLPGAVVLTALLSTTALLRALFVPSAVHWLCFAAMLCSSAGDLFLAHLKALTSRIKNCFTIGCIWFMISHSLYALCYGMKSADLGMPVFNVGAVIALLIGFGIGCTHFPRCFPEEYKKTSFGFDLSLRYPLKLRCGIFLCIFRSSTLCLRCFCGNRRIQFSAFRFHHRAEPHR